MSQRGGSNDAAGQHAGFEIDFGETFTNSELCIAMRDEPACP